MNYCLARDKEGTVAIEFAFVAIPFIWLLIGLIELSLFFTTSSLLAESANVGAREIRVGNLEGNPDPEAAFQKIVCDRAAIFIPCDDIQFQVSVVPDGSYFTAGGMDATFNLDGSLQGAGYEDGAQSSVMLVRLVYYYPFMTPVIGSLLSDTGGTTRMILNTIVMKNEPYDV